jgi:5-hydroxyisourate hydrolase
MISTHILDTTFGTPAESVSVTLEKQAGDGSWISVGSELTNRDGRIAFQCPSDAGTYRLIFEIDPYLRQKGLTPFFISAPVVFQITDTSRKYHVPLLLNPYGYTTYRGS